MRITKTGQTRLLLSYLIYTFGISVVHAEPMLAPIKQVELNEAPPPWAARADVKMPNYAQADDPQTPDENTPKRVNGLIIPTETAFADEAPVNMPAANDAPLTLEDDNKGILSKLFSRKKNKSDEGYAAAEPEKEKGLFGKLFSRKNKEKDYVVENEATKGEGIESWYKNRKNHNLAENSAEDLKVQASQGDSDAQYQLGLMYRSGTGGVEENKYQAIHWLTRSANADNSQAQYALAMLYRENSTNPEDEQKAVSWYQRAANAGHSDAQYSLGLLYANGDSVQQDSNLAIKWFKQSAEQGNMAAKVALIASKEKQGTVAAPTQVSVIEAEPTIDEIADNTDTQEVKAIELTSAPQTTFIDKQATKEPATIEVASKQTPKEEPDEQIRVASITAPPRSRPEAITQDIVEPVMDVNSRTTPSSSPSTVKNATQAVEEITPSDDSNIDVAGIISGAKSGDPKSQLLLGSLYEEGKGGMNQDYEQAANWYRKSADQGYAQAQYNLGLLYEDGKGGIEQDYYEAAQWYKRAASNDFSEAQNNLGVLYIMGKGVIKDINQAELMFRRAAEQGNPNAERNLKMLLKDK